MALTHSELCEYGRRWLTNAARCPIVLVEFVTPLGEIPDNIGFRNEGRDSLVIECKVSRSDFLADKKKPHRQPARAHTALGSYRWYMSEPGVIEVDDLPPGWGLLHVVARRVQLITGAEPQRTYWPNSEDVWRHNRGTREMQLMFSMLRRMQMSLGAKAFREHSTKTFPRPPNYSKLQDNVSAKSAEFLLPPQDAK